MNTCLGAWLRKARARLEASGCPDPAIDARWIAEDTLNLTTTALRFAMDRPLESDERAALDERLERRASGEPVQYILGRADFMGLRFYVDARVLIPRPETETLVEAVVSHLGRGFDGSILDLCTGSGCIGLSIKELLPRAHVVLADASAGALEVARQNARSLSLDVTLRHGDLFGAVPRQRFECVVSNPPYLSRADLEALQTEVAHEPKLALDGGADGLDLYRRIAPALAGHLLPGGDAFFEVGLGQAQAVFALLKTHLDVSFSECIRDLGGVERVVHIRRG